MSQWSEQVRGINVAILDSNDYQKWALVETAVELKIGALLKLSELELTLYCDGKEIAVGQTDSQGRWRIKVEGLTRNSMDLIFEVRARILLATARSVKRQIYKPTMQGKVTEVFEHSDEVELAPEIKMNLPQMEKIRPNIYWMGKQNTAHRIKISRPLAVSATPVTQVLYELVTKQNPSHFKNPKKPVEKVSWWDALKFCNQLSELEDFSPAYRFYEEEGKPAVEWLRSSNGYRLPTEAEWEFVAKAGTELTFSGANDLRSVGWFQDNAKGSTQVVGQKDPNAWKLYDMSGNVWEWCFDEWQEFVYDSRKGQISEDPVVQDKPYANKRVRRGGCWLAFAGSCSAHYRFWAPAVHQGDDTGFRVVRTL